MLAHFSADERLREAFANDEDIHARVASQIYRVPLDQVTSDMRRQAKTVNFGVVYGQSPFGLARSCESTSRKRPSLSKPTLQAIRESKIPQSGTGRLPNEWYVSTILGRRRAIRGVRAEPGRQRNLAERTAINTVIQGSAADLIKLAMLGIHRRLRRDGLQARMLLQIHDELIFEAPAEEIDTLAPLVVEEMANAHPLAVPLKVDVKVGSNWADAKPWNRGI